MITEIDLSVWTPDAPDARPEMEWMTAYPVIGVSYCTFCYGVHRVQRDDLTCTKEPHARQPLGHLYTRCPDHQAKWEADQRAAGRREM